MFRVWWRRQWYAAMLAALMATGGLVMPQFSNAAPLALAAALPATTPQLCAWTRAAIGKTRFGNAGLIDTSATYLMMTFGRIRGISMRIRGEFPHARYMSITVYAGRSAVAVDHILDSSIVPDRGSINPFRPMANRNAQRRAYTVYIEQGLPPTTGAAPNTIYTGPYHPVLVMYRIYAPDDGADVYGNVPKPRVDILVGTAHAPKKVLAEPTCSTPQAVRTGGFTQLVQITNPLQWKRVGAVGGIGVNSDDAYLDVRFNRDDAEVYEIRFKAPTFPRTYRGLGITGQENVRYWSLCQYDMSSSSVIACLHDYQAVASRSGYVTVVISTLANRPSTATQANGINWLPFGREQVSALVYRQLLPSPVFPGNLQNVAPDGLQYEVRSALGRYFPIIQSCSTINFTPASCSDLVNPLFCSDLLEPQPCKPQTTSGIAALPTRSAAMNAVMGRASANRTSAFRRFARHAYHKPLPVVRPQRGS